MMMGLSGSGMTWHRYDPEELSFGFAPFFQAKSLVTFWYHGFFRSFPSCPLTKKT